MFNKIQPYQIKLHTFSSPSGQIETIQSDTEVKINLYSGLTGSYQVEGGLFINGGVALGAHSSNTFEQEVSIATIIGAGRSHILSGTDSAILCGNSNEASGVRNLILNGNTNRIDSGSSDATILAGYGCTIGTGHNGAVLISDARVASKYSIDTNTFNIDFENGVFVQSDMFLQTDLEVGNSGLFSGDFNVLGNMYYDAEEVSTKNYASGISGYLTGWIEEVSGALTGWVEDVSGVLVDTHSNQTINGNKTFGNNLVHNGSNLGFFGVGANSQRPKQWDIINAGGQDVLSGISGIIDVLEAFGFSSTS